MIERSNMSNSRRNFLNFVLGGSLFAWLGAIFYPVFSFLVPPKIPEANVNSVKAGNADEFPANSGAIIKFGRKPVILIKTENSEFKAFAATCTHLDCIVQYKEDTKQIWCACHNGVYDLNGRTVSGPPPRALDNYTVKIVKDEIIITTQAV
ncbi:MAG: Rieske 2Fe-2S domain-containing protein [Cyclobacteriaceae bacterium]|nr:Rieske 2Fe-2S domain-containing protein [Cyclobacteriaceae bacterium]